MSMRDSRLWLIVGGVIAAVVLFLVLRPGDDEAGGPTSPVIETAPETIAPATTEETTTEQATTEQSTTEQTTTEQTPTEPQLQRFTATLEGGSVTGGIQRWSVNQGERVRIVIRSDQADELHLHGYDIEKNVAPGAPAIFAFAATLPGRFELEAHHGGGQIAQLDVEP